MKKIIFVLGGLFVLLIAAVLVGPGLVDWNQYKADIQAQALKATGREVVINGDIKITVLPAPALVARDVSLANIKGGSAPHMTTLKFLEVRVAMAPLLTGRIEVERIKLVDPVIRLEVLDDGRRNWIFGPDAEAAAAGGPGAGGPGAAAGAGAAAVVLDNFTIENGTLTYRDARNGTIERIDAINANIAAASLNGPFESDGGLTFRGVPLKYDVNVGEIIHGRTVPFNLRFGVGAENAGVQVSGTVVNLADAPRVKGRLKGEGKTLADLIQAAVPDMALPGPMDQEFSFEGELNATAKSAELKSLTMKLGATQASGDVTVEYDKTPAFAARIAANRIDLDAWLALAEVPAKAIDLRSGAATGAKTGSSDSPAAGAAVGAPPLGLPRNVTGSLILSAEAITYRKGVIRDAVLNAAMVNGEITLNQAAAQLPGGSDVAVFGFMTVAKGEPRFEGEMEASVNDLRAVMRWLGIEDQGVPTDRLRKMTLVTRVVAVPSQAQLTNIDLTLDSSHLTGGVTVALTRRPSFGADIAIDRLNLDAYLPAPAAGVGKNAGQPTAKPGANGKAAAAPTGDALAGLKVLATFDANMRARINDLTLRGTRLRNAVLDGTLYNGALDLRRLSVGDIAGASLSASGKLSNIGTTPEAKALTLKVETADLPRLLALGGIKSTVPAKRIGTVRLSARLDGSFQAPKVDVAVDGVASTLRVKGALGDIALMPAVKQLNIQVETADAPRLLSLAGMNVPAAARDLGKVRVEGTLDGNLLAPTVSLGVKAAGADVVVKGPVNPLAIGDMADLSVQARHPELSQLLSRLGAGYRPAGKTGALAFNARVKGGPTAWTVSGLDATIGKSAVKGDVAIDLGGKRPSVKANLVAGALVLDPFLPAEKSASLMAPLDGRPAVIPAAWPGTVGVPAKTLEPGIRLAAAGRWPTDPIDLSGLGAVDGDVTLKSPLIRLEQYALENADIVAHAKDGRFKAERIAGGLFGGQLQATVDATASARPRIATVFALENMNMESATRAMTGNAVATGRMSMKGNLTTAGRNMADMISALNGDGAMQMRDVDVSGANTGTAMAGALGLVSAFDQLAGGLGGAKAGSGADIAGSFQIRNGVATSSNMQVRAGVGEGTASGSVDLPRWRIDVRGQVQLSANVLTALLSAKTKTNVTQAVPFTVRGRLDAPTVNLDTSKLPGGALPIPGVDKLIKKAPKGVGTILQGILGGSQQQQGTSGETQQQQQPPPPSQKVTPQDLLQQLFRR